MSFQGLEEDIDHFESLSISISIPDYIAIETVLGMTNIPAQRLKYLLRAHPVKFLYTWHAYPERFPTWF